jgi:hypothetical protein
MAWEWGQCCEDPKLIEWDLKLAEKIPLQLKIKYPVGTCSLQPPWLFADV